VFFNGTDFEWKLFPDSQSYSSTPSVLHFPQLTLVTQGCLLIVIVRGGNTFSLVAKQKFYNPYCCDVFREILTCNALSIN